jgi:hypothetical protein
MSPSHVPLNFEVHLPLKYHGHSADQKTSFPCGTHHLFQLIKKHPYLMEPSTFFSRPENILILWNPTPFSADQKTSLSYGTQHFFSWLENFLMLWNSTTFPADQKTSLSYGTEHLFSWSENFLSYGTQHLFQLIRKLPYLTEPNTFI